MNRSGPSSATSRPAGAAPRRSADAAAPAPDTTARARKGGRPRAARRVASAAASRPGHRDRGAKYHVVRIRVWTTTRPGCRPSAAPKRRDRRRGGSPQREGRAPPPRPGNGGRSAPGRSPETRPPKPGAPGGAPPRCRRGRRPRPGSRAVADETSSTGSPTRAAISSAARAVPSRRRLKRAEPQAAQTNGRALPQTGQPSAEPSPPASTSADPQRSQRTMARQAPQASSLARPVRLSTQTTGIPGRTHRDARTISAKRALKSPERGSSPRRSITSTVAHPACSVAGSRVTSDDDARQPSVGHGLTNRHGTPARARPLGRDDGRVPRRGALFDVGLRVGVEHDDETEPPDRGEGGRPRADNDAAAAGRLGPRLRLQRDRPSQPAEPLGERLGVTPCRREHEGVEAAPRGERRHDDLEAGGGRREPQHRRRRRERPPGRLRDRRVLRCRGGPPHRSGRRQGAHEAPRRPGDEERPQPAGVAPGAETPEPDDLGRGTARHHVDDLSQLVAVGLADDSATTQPRTLRPCSGTRTIEPSSTARTRSRPARRSRSSGRHP